MRERVRHTGLNAPHKRDVMFCAPYLHVSDSRVRLMPSEVEYDIFARTDTESASWFTGHVIESEGVVMGVSADWFIYFAAYFLCVFVQLDTANATKPSQRISVQLSAKAHCFHGSRHSGLPRHYQALRQTVLILVSVLIALCAGSFLLTSFSSFYSTLPCPTLSLFSIPKFLSFHITSTRSHLWNLTQFLTPDFFFPSPIRGHANLQRQTTLRIQKYPICSSNMLIFFLCCSRNGNRMVSKADFKSASLCLLRNTSLGDKSSFALC